MSVSLILADKGHDVFTVTADSLISDVIGLLAEKKIGAAVVLRDDKVCGIASERDIVRELARDGADAFDMPVSACMTEKVISCSEDDSIDSVMEKMTSGRFRHVPVITDGKLVGLISIGDVVKRKIQQAEHDVEDLKRYIAS